MGTDETLDYIATNFRIELGQPSPIEIPNVNRKELAKLFRRLSFRVGAEIGSESGVYSRDLCKCNPWAKIYLIDAWKAYKGYREYVSQAKIDTFYEKIQERLKTFNNYEIIKKFSMDAVKDFEDESLDFVYIDANHQFEYVVQDIGFWSKKVRKGGIISGHNYIRRARPTATHVVQAVQDTYIVMELNPGSCLGAKQKSLVRLGITRGVGSG